MGLRLTFWKNVVYYVSEERTSGGPALGLKRGEVQARARSVVALRGVSTADYPLGTLIQLRLPCPRVRRRWTGGQAFNRRWGPAPVKERGYA